MRFRIQEGKRNADPGPDRHVPDAGVGAIYDALKATGMYDNTVLILSTDNGGAIENISNLPLKVDRWGGVISDKNKKPALGKLSQIVKGPQFQNFTFEMFLTWCIWPQQMLNVIRK